MWGQIPRLARYTPRSNLLCSASCGLPFGKIRICYSFQLQKKKGFILAKRLVATTILLLAVSAILPAQTVKNLAHPAPDGAYVEYLMTDGTVVVQGGGTNDFWKLTPDNKGS